MYRKFTLILLGGLLFAHSLSAQEHPAFTTLTPEGRLFQVLNYQPAEMSDESLTRQIAMLYRNHANALVAVASDRQGEAEEILSSSMDMIRTMLSYPGITENIRFRELYRTIVAEYENVFGTANPDFIAENDEIYQLRAEIFSELDQNRGLLLENVNIPEVDQFRSSPPPTVFPMDLETPVVSAIRSMSRRKDYFRRVRTRADIYFPMIEKIFSEEGVPDELKYLSMVESALNPRAQSWASAVGLWQFIPATGGAYGLNISNFVDERRDPEKSSRAAARHLRDLYDMFGGDWQLAIAGYNCSPARVKREMRKAETRNGRKATFWDIMNDLPRETRDYVPLFIATYYIMNNPETFELGPYTPGPSYEYDVVPVRGGSSIETIASRVGVNSATLLALNPELLTESLPQSTPSGYLPDQNLVINAASVSNDAYHLRVPLNSSGLLQDLAVADASQVRYGPRYAVSNPIETNLASSASTNGTNGSSEPAQAINDLSKLIGSAPAQTSTRSTSSSSSNSGTRVTHRVGRGETLTSIANRYGVTVSGIRQWNNIRGSKILRNQRLVIYSNRAAPTAAAVSTHRVRRGESLSTIARRYGTSVSRLKSLNGLQSNTIRVGQNLKVR